MGKALRNAEFFVVRGHESPSGQALCAEGSVRAAAPARSVSVRLQGKTRVWNECLPF